MNVVKTRAQCALKHGVGQSTQAPTFQYPFTDSSRVSMQGQSNLRNQGGVMDHCVVRNNAVGTYAYCPLSTLSSAIPDDAYISAAGTEPPRQTAFDLDREPADDSRQAFKQDGRRSADNGEKHPQMPDAQSKEVLV